VALRPQIALGLPFRHLLLHFKYNIYKVLCQVFFTSEKAAFSLFNVPKLLAKYPPLKYFNPCKKQHQKTGSDNKTPVLLSDPVLNWTFQIGHFSSDWTF
jgi:hypothetical protein